MRDPHARSGGSPSEPRRLRVPAVLLALLAMAALGPLAAVAVGQGGVIAQSAGNPPTATGVTMTAVPSPYSIPTTTTTSTPPPTKPYTVPTTTTPPVISPGPAGNPFATRGMWIWVLRSSDGGRLSVIAAQAKADGIGTLMIKSSDGVQFWPQFSARMVSSFHRDRLHVCAWQFVYGIKPAQEAQLGARAVRDGADCLLIDAESQYEGKYVQAQTYIRTLRKLIGRRFPVGLAGFPYVDLHPAFPYSVFLGPGGAQVNTPQMYWRDIGTTVTAVYRHTYAFNSLYERPIYPLGQVFESPPRSQVLAFRTASLAYHAKGVSWWDWQDAGAVQFHAIAGRAPLPRGPAPATALASLGRGAIGDVVVWAQEHLVSAGFRLAIDGIFGPLTQAAVERFQAQHHLAPSGIVTPATWSILLRFAPVSVTWTATKSGATATATAPKRAIVLDGGASAAVLPMPASARAPARGDELRGAPGEGYPGSPADGRPGALRER